MSGRQDEVLSDDGSTAVMAVTLVRTQKLDLGVPRQGPVGSAGAVQDLELRCVAANRPGNQGLAISELVSVNQIIQNCIVVFRKHRQCYFLEQVNHQQLLISYLRLESNWRSKVYVVNVDDIKATSLHEWSPHALSPNSLVTDSLTNQSIRL